MSMPEGQFAELMARLEQTSVELDAVAVQQRAEWDQARSRWAEDDEQRARRARAGDLGPQWQRLQRRIDLDETSVEDVVRGRDESADAEVVMADAHHNAEALGAELDQQDELGEVPELQVQRAEMAELAVLLDELRALVHGPDQRPPA